MHSNRYISITYEDPVIKLSRFFTNIKIIINRQQL